MHRARLSFVVGVFCLTLCLACDDGARSAAPEAGASGFVAVAADGGASGSGNQTAAAGRASAGTLAVGTDGGSAGLTEAGRAGQAGRAGEASAGSLAAGGGGQPALEPGVPLLVGVGSFGLRGVSRDADTWSYCGEPSGGDDHAPSLLRNVSFGDGVFVAVGGDANSMVMRTEDGVHWREDLHSTTSCAGESYPASCKNWMGAVAYLDHHWLAGGGNGALMSSQDDGLTWSGVHGNFPERHIRALGAGSGVFIAGTDGGGLFVSRDYGLNWNAEDVWRNAASSAFLELAHHDGVFIAYAGSAQGCFVSSDGATTWKACAAEVAAASSFVHDGTHWVAATPNGYATSVDAQSWTSHAADKVPAELRFDGETWYGRTGTQIYVGGTPDTLARVAMNVPDYRAWTVGRILNGADTTGALCQDNR